MTSFTVKISTDVYRFCFQHALSTKAEEIMGLLIGEMKEEENVLEILSFKINLRMDKQPDRVEISPEQMINAAEAAEDLAKKIKASKYSCRWMVSFSSEHHSLAISCGSPDPI